jgi:hypothetical protein
MAHVYGRELASNWRAHWPKFAIARFARIYPLFALTMLAMMTTVSVTDATLRSVSFSLRSLVLQPFSAATMVRPKLVLSILVHQHGSRSVYLFVFSAGLLVTGKHPGFMAACCVAILAALCIAKGESLNLCSGISALVRTLSEFFLGSLLYRAYSNHAGFPREWALILAVLFVGLATITNLDFLIVGAFLGLIYYGNATDAFGKLLNSRPG